MGDFVEHETTGRPRENPIVGSSRNRILGCLEKVGGSIVTDVPSNCGVGSSHAVGENDEEGRLTRGQRSDWF